MFGIAPDDACKMAFFGRFWTFILVYPRWEREWGWMLRGGKEPRIVFGFAARLKSGPDGVHNLPVFGY